MDSNGDPGASALSALCERLRSEKLLVASELETLHKLNEQVDAEQMSLAQLSWVGRQQQVIVHHFILKFTFHFEIAFFLSLDFGTV